MYLAEHKKTYLLKLHFMMTEPVHQPKKENVLQTQTVYLLFHLMRESLFCLVSSNRTSYCQASTG